MISTSVLETLLSNSLSDISDISEIKKNVFRILTDDDELFAVKIASSEEDHRVRALQHEFEYLQHVEELPCTPDAIDCLTEQVGPLKITISVYEFVDGYKTPQFSAEHLRAIARTFKQIHGLHIFRKPGKSIPPDFDLPYECPLYDKWINSSDHRLETYIPHLPGLADIEKDFNAIKSELKEWFNELTCFDECRSFHICVNNPRQDVLTFTPDGLKVINWENAIIDIPELDIAQFLVYNIVDNDHKEIFMDAYYGKKRDHEVIERLDALTKFLEFFKILDDYAISQTKKWSAKEAKTALKDFKKKYL